MTNWPKKKYQIIPETPSISFFLLGTKINLTYIYVCTMFLQHLELLLIKQKQKYEPLT